jgi:primosomal protein N' (replication factor Y) (superfamily II helicase)
MRPAEDGVRYHARDMVVVVRGHIANIPIVLSAATPSIESEVHARRGRYARLSPPERSRRGASRPRGLRPKSKKDAPARAIPFDARPKLLPGRAPNM